jgi:cell division protein FtsW (lipid II flippase)
MKKIISLQAKKVFSKAALFIAALILSCYSFAQDKKVEVDINTKSENTNFFMQPWVWIVGGAVFILLLVALLRGGGSKK